MRPDPSNLVRISARDRHACDQWNACVAAHHYLGYTPLTGAQMRIRRLRPLRLPRWPCIGFADAAWPRHPATASSDGRHKLDNATSASVNNFACS